MLFIIDFIIEARYNNEQALIVVCYNKERKTYGKAIKSRKSK